MNRKLLSHLLQWALLLSLPLLLLAADIRLVTGHWFVRWEYKKPGFPPDPFGLSTEERIRLAEVCQDYLAANASISLLADLQLPNGDPAFNVRELLHMSDVQLVYHAITIVGIIAALTWLAGILILVAVGHAERIPDALLGGSLLTLGLLAAAGIFMLLGWGAFFNTFHRVFFEGDSWIFPTSDTLIRLFPMRFWMDIAVTLVGMLVVESLIIGVLVQLGERVSAKFDL